VIVAAGGIYAVIYWEQHGDEIVALMDGCLNGSAADRWLAAQASQSNVSAATETDKYKEHLKPSDLEGAKRQAEGDDSLRWTSSGKPMNHKQEVQDAQRGLIRRIRQIKNRLSDPEITDTEREALTAELGEASRLLDHSQRYLPR
jgi:hypothetical protein